MFWRKTRAAIEQFPQQHQTLLWHRTLYASYPPADWVALTDSLVRHPSVVRRRKWALPPRTLDLLVPLIQVLVQDVGRTGTLTVSADLRGDTVPDKAGPEQTLPAPGRIRSAAQWFVTDPWLRLRAELSDGSVLELNVTDRVRRRRIRSVSSSGKHKTKLKSKEIQVVRVRRTLPKGVTGHQPAPPPPGWIRVALRDGRRRSLTATGKTFRAPTPQDQLQQILYVVAELFRWTAPVSGATPAAGDPNTANGRYA